MLHYGVVDPKGKISLDRLKYLLGRGLLWVWPLRSGLGRYLDSKPLGQRLSSEIEESTGSVVPSSSLWDRRTVTFGKWWLGDRGI